MRALAAAATAGVSPPSRSTFGEVPSPNSISGRTPANRPRLEVLCTNPASLGGVSSAIDPVFPRKPFAPGTIGSVIPLVGQPRLTASTTWIEIRDAYRARCCAGGGANVLRIQARSFAARRR